MKELLHRPQAREEPAKANCLGEGQLKRKVSRAAEGTPRPEGRGGHYSPIFRWSRSSCAACPRPLCSSAADCTAELHGQIKWLNFNCGQRGRALEVKLIWKLIVLFLFRITACSPAAPTPSVDQGAHTP